MFERLKYKNHINEVIDFGVDGIYVNANTLHDYTWTAQKTGGKVAALTKGIQTRSIPVVILCDTEEKGIATRNRFFEICEKDVLAMQPGEILIGDYAFRCYVTGSTKRKYNKTGRQMVFNLTVTSDYPYWLREVSKSFGSAATSGEGLDYPFDFAMDYMTDVAITDLINTNFVESNFRLVIYGPCVNPDINISGHTYQVFCTVSPGEYLTIESSSKKIWITKNDGTKENQFANRNKDSYIFQKIPAGSNPIAWDGSFGFDVILIEERSEPKWT